MSQLKDDFIVALRETGLFATSARKAKSTAKKIRKLMNEDEIFAQQVEEQLDLFMDKVESEAIHRAVDGVEKPLYHKGQLVDTVTEYSDRLLEKILTSRRPEVYGKKQKIETNAPISIKIAQFEPDFL